ncbi:hypothetical protein OQA88_5700 [Cercophora sp. LCS_1]
MFSPAALSQQTVQANTPTIYQTSNYGPVSYLQNNNMAPLIVLDFDGTITKQDTIDSLALAVIEHRGEHTPKTWDDIVDAWLDDHNRHVATYVPSQADRTDPASELAFLESLKVVENASIARVDESNIFKGASAEELMKLGNEAVQKGVVKLRDGWKGFLGELNGRGWETGLVSINWSKHWVRGCLGGEEDWGRVEKWMTNEVEGEKGVLVGPGGVGGYEVMMTARDKLEATRQLVEATEEKAWVYVGDSTTDLACLLEANMGIVMADDEQSKLLRTLRRVGFEVQRAAEGPARLVWVKDFDELLSSGVLDRVQKLS